MHILNESSFFLTNKTGAPQGEELGLMKPLSESSCSYSDNSFISDGAKRYGARATGATPRIRSIWNSTGRAGDRPSKFSRNTSGKSWTIASNISSIGVASAPAIAGIVSYFVVFVTLHGAQARVIALALGALGRISLIVLFLSRSQVVCFRDILLLERLLVVSGDVIRLSLTIRFSFRI
nr:hypothetical protein [Tanacetum cinerariifolium]